MASKVETTDPNVRKMVYNMYRGMLGNYNNKANDMISTLPKNTKVLQDQGVSNQLDSMIRQSNQISGGGTVPGPPPGGPPPPPPPPGCTGAIPSLRIPSEVGPVRREPPAAIQNAMMTKDKKPFTYTPGGLDLAEIRSPRMAKRISRNALTDDSCSSPVPAVAAQPVQPHQLPPSALAAMQPQIAIPVLPSGGIPLHRPGTAAKPGPPAPPMPGCIPAGGAVPPPPPPPTAQSHIPPPPPPPPVNGIAPPGPSNVGEVLKRSPVPSNRPPPDYIADIANHAPLKHVNHYPKSQHEPDSHSFPMIQLRPTGLQHKLQEETTDSEPPFCIPPSQESPPRPESNQERPALKIQSPQYSRVEPQFSSPPRPQSQEQQVKDFNLAQPIQDRQSPFQGTQQIKPTEQRQIQNRPLPSEPVVNKFEPERQFMPPHAKEQFKVPGAGIQIPEEHQNPFRQTPPSPAGLKQSPAPWMTAQRHNQKQVPAWACRTPSVEEPLHPGAKTPPVRTPISPPVNQPSGVTRIIPIHVEGNEESPVPRFQQPVETQNSTGRTRIIPIQIERDEPASSSSSHQPRNSPISPNQQQRNNANEGGRRQYEAQRSWTPNSAPVQSRSFRVLQKITGSEPDDQAEEETKEGGELIFLVNRVYPRSELGPPVYEEPLYSLPTYAPNQRMVSPYDNNCIPGESEY